MHPAAELRHELFRIDEPHGEFARGEHDKPLIATGIVAKIESSKCPKAAELPPPRATMRS